LPSTTTSVKVIDIVDAVDLGTQHHADDSDCAALSVAWLVATVTKRGAARLNEALAAGRLPTVVASQPRSGQQDPGPPGEKTCAALSDASQACAIMDSMI